MRFPRTPSLAAVAYAALSLGVCGLSGCHSKPADGALVEPERVDAKQKEDVKAQYQKQRQERKANAKKAKSGRVQKPRG